MIIPRYVRMSRLASKPRANPPVHGIVPLEASTIWRLVKAGNFPAPVRLSANTVAWDLAEVESWLNARKEERA
jgi:predicted DNA-binding transcriptional regulator AlpA